MIDMDTIAATQVRPHQSLGDLPPKGVRNHE